MAIEESPENAPLDPPTDSSIAPVDSGSPNFPHPPSWSEMMERAQRIRLLGLRQVVLTLMGKLGLQNGNAGTKKNDDDDDDDDDDADADEGDD